MAPQTTDLLKKYKSLFSTTLSVGIGTGTGDTITPASVSGLPTDTLITLTFDRVDSGGSATPTKLERIQGIVSGGNFVSYTRGIDGTTEQAHAGGAVIEMIWNADDWNDAVTWGLTEHNQLGGHTNITASNITASGVSTLTSLTATSLYKSTLKSNVSEVITTAGGTTVYTLTPSVAIASYATGQEFTILMNATNTGASTINVSGLGAKALTKGGATALSSGDLLINAEYKIIYDGTQFQVIGISGSSATVASASDVTTGTDNVKMVTSLAATGIDTRTATFTNKTLTSPVIRNYDGWIDANATWTYASASTITVPSGAASIYQKGDRIKWTQTTVKYGVIVAVADTLLTIAVNTDYTVANAAITANYYSHEANPLGYPGKFSFTSTLTGFSGSPTNNSSYSITGSTVNFNIYVSGTSNANGASFTVPVAVSSVAGTYIRFIGKGQDNSTNLTAPVYMDLGTSSSTATVYKDSTAAAFTVSGTKEFAFNFSYQF